MIVCKITLNKQEEVDYNKIFSKVLDMGDFIMMASDEAYEILFASEEEDVDENYIRKALRKHKIDFMIHVYSLNDKFDFDSYTNQWVINNLDKQFKIKIEKEQQPELNKISKKLELLDKVLDETEKAKQRYEQAADLIAAQKQEGASTPEEK